LKKFASVVALAVIFGLGGTSAANAVAVPNRKAVVTLEKERSVTLEKERSITQEKER
jgi:hypothetical protein